MENDPVYVRQIESPAHIFVAPLFDVDLDLDCACPDRPFVTHSRATDSQLWQQTPDTFTVALPQNFYLAYSPYAPAGPSVLNESAWARWQSFHLPQACKESIDTTLQEQRLIQSFGTPHWATNSDPQTLTAWLHVTNACNLDCPYCYVRKSSAAMNAEIGLSAVEQIFDTAQSNHFTRVKLKYAGGEAFLHFRLIRELHERAQQLSAQTGIALREVVLTNGTLIRPEIADWLAQAKMKVMVSLDGIGEIHDQQRPRVGGGKTFETVERTVDEILRPRGILPDITITVTGMNARGIADAVEWALARELPVSLNLYRQNPLAVSRRELVLEEAAIVEGMSAAYEVFEKYLPTRPFFDGLLDRVQSTAHTHTCGVGISYLVISHQGKVAQCQMHLGESVSPIENISLLGIVREGKLRNLSVDEKEGCRHCAYRYRCSGGCPIETLRATGRFDVSSPNCGIYRALLPQALRLEGLRLLKVHGYLN